MKRDPALIPLSHDHQHGLAVAYVLRHDDDLAAARERFLAFYAEEGRRHFEIEEQVLLEVIADVIAPTDPDVARVYEEHAELRSRVEKMALESEPPPDLIRETGDLLEGHIRHEERTLFPRIEAELDEERLAELGMLLAEAEAAD